MACSHSNETAASVTRKRKDKGASKTKQTQREFMSFHRLTPSQRHRLGLQVPRQHSVKAHDLRNATAFHPGQADWSIDNMPEIMYAFMPSISDDVKQRVPLKTYPIHGEYLCDFPVLPDNISSDVEEFRVEAWMRLDRRIHLSDITSRMHPEFRIHQNTLQQRGVRFRKAFFMIAWGSGNKETDNLKAKIVSEMERKGIDPEHNSTRGLTPGLVHPELGEVGGRIPVPRQYTQKKLDVRAADADVAVAAPTAEAQDAPLSLFPKANDTIQECINPAVLLINTNDTEPKPIDFERLATVWDFPGAMPSHNRVFKRAAFPKPVYSRPQKNAVSINSILLGRFKPTGVPRSAMPAKPSDLMDSGLPMSEPLCLPQSIPNSETAEIWNETLDEFF